MAQYAISSCDIYRHSPLPGPRYFRLVELWPGSNDDALVCSFETSSLDAAPRYEALSYAWGDPDFSQEVRAEDTVLPITSNLASALRRLRYRDKKRGLWIDGLSIDQNSLIDKESQIPLMFSIYQQASKVVVYLGERADGSELVHGLICANVYAHAVAKAVDMSWAEREASIRQLVPPNDTSYMQPGHVAWKAFASFFGRPWMRRAWVVQEVVAAQKIVFICGEWQLPGNTMKQALHGCMEYTRWFPCGHDADDERQEGFFQLLRSLAMANGKMNNYKGNLMTVLLLARGTKASGRRDHLYALLGLSTDANVGELRPDYTECWQRTYLRYAKCFVRCGQGLDLLYRSSLDTESLAKSNRILPSWAPDWSYFERDRIGHLLQTSSNDDNPNRYAATKTAWPRISFADDRTLIVSAKIVDRVELLGPIRNGHRLFSDMLTRIRNIRKTSECLADLPMKLEKIFSLNVWTHPDFLIAISEVKQLISERREIGDPVAHIKEMLSTLLCDRRLHRQIMLLNQSPEPPFVLATRGYDTMSLYRTKEAALAEISLIWSGLCGCVTSTGLLGQVPLCAAEGDCVALIVGAAVPFIFRPNGDGFRIIGQAYFHRLMKGEGLDPSFGPLGALKLV